LRSLLFLSLLPLLVSNALAAVTLEGETTWSGRQVITSSVTVSRGATLTIAPGAELRFADGAELHIEGQLTAVGTAEQPIVFLADAAVDGSWPGIAFQSAAGPGTLEHVRIDGAQVGVSVVSSKVRIANSQIEGGGKGIAMAVDAEVNVEAVTLRGMREGGIDASVRARAQISDCRIEAIGDGGFGIQVAKQAIASIRNNRISQAKIGILLNGDFPPLEGNVIEGCEVGIGLIQSGPSSVVRGNRVSNSGTGIGCRQFCSPLIEQNLVDGCQVGIECYQSSSPMISRNRLRHNERGLSCVQMCNPVVQGNQIADNQVGVYLHLSSYATFHQNNFEENRLHFDLDNMSYDWELRASHKPKRNLQAQNERLAQQGRAVRKEIEVEVSSEGFVDASGNYWGEATTLEMEQKGAEANIAGINDGFDVPVLTYEGWQGEYKKDRVRYAGWLKMPVPIDPLMTGG